jgi:hypothetical protein
MLLAEHKIKTLEKSQKNIQHYNPTFSAMMLKRFSTPRKKNFCLRFRSFIFANTT